MGKTIGKAVANELGMKYKGVSYRPDLYEVTATDMTAIIFEAGAIKADLKKLKAAETYGRALARADCKYLGVLFIPLPAAGYFKSGAKGWKVKELQTWLKKKKYYTGKIDSIVGKSTIEAVKKFQEANGLTVDGKFGEKSLLKANDIS